MITTARQNLGSESKLTDESRTEATTTITIGWMMNAVKEFCERNFQSLPAELKWPRKKDIANMLIPTAKVESQSA
jgi:hypothetical protein